MANIAEKNKVPILPPHGYVRRLARELNCSHTMVTNAIRHNMQTPLCDKIREAYYLLIYPKNEQENGN